MKPTGKWGTRLAITNSGAADATTPPVRRAVRPPRLPLLGRRGPRRGRARLAAGEGRPGPPGPPRAAAPPPEGAAGAPHLPVRRPEPGRFLRLQARPPAAARALAPDRGAARRVLRPGGLAAPERLGLPPPRPERAVDLGPVPAPRRRGRRTDGHQLDGGRNVQPHAGHVPGEHRLPSERLPRAGLLALLRPGQRHGRPAGLRGAARRPRRAGRRQ